MGRWVCAVCLPRGLPACSVLPLTASMTSRIPEPVLRADQVHHEVLRSVAFSRHLNPVNAPEARHAFLRGAFAPPFEYVPLVDADLHLARLDGAEPPRDHPAGELVGRCMDGTRLLLRALRDRTASAFHALAVRGGWYPGEELLALRFPDADDLEPMSVSADRVMRRLREALAERGLEGWKVVADTVMAARVLVDGAKRIVRVNPQSRFRPRDVERLVVHEIDVHALRADNGQSQALRCFQTGLPNSLGTEEGLAMLTEERAGVASPGVLARQAHVVRAIDLARSLGFRDLYTELHGELGAGLAWGICLRIKRGLARPGQPGVYAKDSVYLSGRMALREWLDQGGDVRLLYVGKVGVDDPIERWVQQGWVTLCPVAPSWKGRRGDVSR